MDRSEITEIKQYRFTRELGRGAMGAVFEAVDGRDGSRVAVKILHPWLAASDPTFRDRFEREAHIAALLRSPYTVHLLDFGSANGTYFLVMEFVEGTTLAKELANGPLEPARACRIAAEVARALEEANARSVVHRDIKPDNILLTTEGRVKVADFGIARQEGGAGVTAVGGFVGTPEFASPEQAATGEVDHRSDIYSLGAVLYCMLTGHPPFRGTSAWDILRQHQHAQLPMAPLAHLPDAITNPIRRAMEKDPRDRYPTTSEFAGALERSMSTLTGLPATSSGRAPSPPSAAPQSPPATRPPAFDPHSPLEAPTAVGEQPAAPPGGTRAVSPPVPPATRASGNPGPAAPVAREAPTVIRNEPPSPSGPIPTRLAGGPPNVGPAPTRVAGGPPTGDFPTRVAGGPPPTGDFPTRVAGGPPPAAGTPTRLVGPPPAPPYDAPGMKPAAGGPAFALNLTPTGTGEAGMTRFTLAITNNSGMGTLLRLTGDEPTGVLQISIAPTITLGPGRTQQVPVEVRQLRMPRSPQPIQFQVRAETETGARAGFANASVVPAAGSGGQRRTGLILAAGLVVVGAGVAAFLLFGGGGSSNSKATSETPAATSPVGTTVGGASPQAPSSTPVVSPSATAVPPGIRVLDRWDYAFTVQTSDCAWAKPGDRHPISFKFEPSGSQATMVRDGDRTRVTGITDAGPIVLGTFTFRVKDFEFTYPVTAANGQRGTAVLKSSFSDETTIGASSLSEKYDAGCTITAGPAS